MNSQNGSLPDGKGLEADRIQSRAKVLASYGASPGETEELLRYNSNTFAFAMPGNVQFPLADEGYVEAWSMYSAEVARANDFKAIYPWIPQLQFPIQEGLSQKSEYIAATRQGLMTYPEGIASGLYLERPDRCRIILHSGMAGRIPVILTASRADFVALVRAFTKKGEPVPVPESMGAVIIGGYNNWHRIQLLRDAYFAAENSGWDWQAKFQEIKEQKDLYQDRFIILSPGAYSGVEAASLQLEDEQWASISVAIRLEHECTHFFTRRVFGSMRNNLLDELIADYCGLDKAVAEYSAEWALRFLGLEEDAGYRIGGRLENYRGNPPLSHSSFAILGRLVRDVVANLERFNAATAAWRGTDPYRVASILTLVNFTLEELAAQGAEARLTQQFGMHQALLEESMAKA